MTSSEDLFEKFCKENNIVCSKIEESTTKTPDYKIEIDGVTVIAEIKQIDPNKEEQALIRKLENGEIIRTGGTPGDRVRSKIKSASPQLSKLAKGKHPSIVVLYNNLPFVLGNPTEAYNIRVGMYGLETIVLSISNNYEAPPSVVDRKFGPKRKLTEEHNTSISAVAVLSLNPEGESSLEVYHNQFAAIPLPYGLVSTRNAKEYILSDNQTGVFQEWVAYTANKAI